MKVHHIPFKRVYGFCDTALSTQFVKGGGTVVLHDVPPEVLQYAQVTSGNGVVWDVDANQLIFYNKSATVVLPCANGRRHALRIERIENDSVTVHIHNSVKNLSPPDIRRQSGGRY